MFVDFNILNQLGSPSINSNTFANRPSAGQVGRLFVSTDTFEIYRDNGTGWDLIGGPGSSTVTGSGAAGQVTYWTGTNSVGGENNLWWDAANNRFGVNTNTPTAAAEVVQTDGVALYSNFTTNAGSGAGTTAILAKNTTNGSGYAAVIEERTPNVSAGQYPVLIRHTLSSGTAATNMATGIHFGLPDDAGTERINQFSMDTVDAAAATYSSRYRFLLRNNGSAVTPFYITGTGLGVFTATPGAALDIHSTGIIAQFNTTSGTGNTYIAFQRTGTGIWRIGDTYNGGNNFFELHNTVLGVDAMEFQASTNKSTFQAQETYTTGLARGNYFDYNLSVAAGGSFSSPNAITSLGASLDLSLAGNATIPSGARSGLDAYNSIAFTGTGTLTQNQGSQIRAYSNLTTGWAFGGSATGTITHLAGLRVLFPDNTGSAIAITNNYGLLINDQTANTGTVTYTNRWGVYQEGASDLNYFAANTLIGTTTNSGQKLVVNGATRFFQSTGITTIIESDWDRSLTNDTQLYIRGNSNTNKQLRIGFDTTANLGYIQALTSGIGTNDILINPSGGNVGLGVTPAAWGVFDKVLQVGGASVSNYQNADNTMFGSNMYYGGSPANFRYITNGTASLYRMDAADHKWFNAPSGTAGNAISFTQSMTLNAASDRTNLLVGTTTLINNASGRGNVVINGSSNSILTYAIGNSEVAYMYHNGTNMFITNGTGYLALTPSTNVLIGTTTDAGEKLQVSGRTKSTAYYSIKGTQSIASGATATIYSIPAATSADGIYFVHVEVSSGSSIYMASGIVTALGGNGEAFFTSLYDGANVTLQVTGLNIEVVNNGFGTFTWSYSILFQSNS